MRHRDVSFMSLEVSPCLSRNSRTDSSLGMRHELSTHGYSFNKLEKHGVNEDYIFPLLLYPNDNLNKFTQLYIFWNLGVDRI